MPLPLVIPAAIGVYEALVALGGAIAAVAAVLAAREGGKKLAQAVQNAQAEADDGAESKIAPVAATAQCKDCKPDPNCGKWLDQAKQALYAVKVPRGMGGAGGGAKGLMQMVCEWIHGTVPGGSDHTTAVREALNALNTAMKKLGDMKHGCTVPENVKTDVDDIKDRLGEKGEKLMSLPHEPKADFQAHCVAKALAIARNRGR